MTKLNLQKSEITTLGGTDIRLVYDEDGDILDIYFGENEPATGVELTEHVILRLNKKAERAISLIINNFSVLTEQTEYGPRNFPLSRLANQPEDLRDLILRLVTSSPVSQFVKLSSYQASTMDSIPCIYVEQEPMATYA